MSANFGWGPAAPFRPQHTTCRLSASPTPATNRPLRHLPINMAGCLRASTTCVALFWWARRGTAFAVPSTVMHQKVDGRLTKRGCSSKDDVASPLYDNTLVSIRQCIDAVNQEQQQGSHANPSPRTVFVDGSWYHKPDPTTGLTRYPAREFTAGPRAPNARFLDIDAIATTYELFPDRNPKALPHMMPPPKLFGLAMDAYNIQNEDHIIVYAKRGALFTPRVWYLFICMGHDPKKVHLMQGSLEDYIEEGGLLDTHSLLTREDEHQYYDTIGGNYADCFDQGILNVQRLYHEYNEVTPQYNLNVSNAMNICNKEEVLDTVKQYLERKDDIKQSKSVIIDTRGSGYSIKGHIPSAIHLPYSKIASPTNSLVIQPKSTLKKLFEERAIDYLDPELKIILSCGSGV